MQHSHNNAGNGFDATWFYSSLRGAVSRRQAPTAAHALFVRLFAGLLLVVCFGLWGAFAQSSIDTGSCPAGNACFSNGTTLPCPAGYYCRNGTDASCSNSAPDTLGCGPIACRAGVRCPGGSATADGLPTGGICPAGFVCSTTSNETSPCPARNYCPAGSARCVVTDGKSECLGGPPLCPFGVRCPGGSAAVDGLPTGGICPAGSVCDTDGRVLPCPPGSWCPAGTSNEGEPFPVRCRPGVLCLDGAADDLGGPTPANGGLCPAGFYCGEGSSVPSGSCAPGYFCPEGSYTGA